MIDRVPLDPNRVENARRKVATSLNVIKHHERAIASESAKIGSLIRTWGLCPDPNEDNGFCCNNPLECQGRQQ